MDFKQQKSFVLEVFRDRDFQRSNVCIVCGALVVYQELHSAWHAVSERSRPAAPTVPQSQPAERRPRCEKCGAFGATYNYGGVTVCHACGPTAQDSARPAQTAEKREAICKICERRIILSGTFWCHNEPLSAEESQTIPLHEATPAAAPPPHPATQGGDVVDAAEGGRMASDGVMMWRSDHRAIYAKQEQTIGALMGRIAELERELLESRWTRITLENLPQEEHEVIRWRKDILGSFHQILAVPDLFEWASADYAEWIAAGWTHFRKINAPTGKGDAK